MLPSPAEAEAVIFAALPMVATETCSLERAQGRVLRQDLVADRDLPPFDRVTMDGYALRHADWLAGKREFVVKGFRAAGLAAEALSAGVECVEIATGAVMPPGADCVVPYEMTTRHGDTIVISTEADLARGRNVHPRGSDFPQGTVLVRRGARLSGREIAVAAACGCAEVFVARLPRVYIIATGDELVDVGSPTIAPHQVRRSNDQALAAALQGANYGQATCLHLRDIRQDIVATLRRVLTEADVVLLTGGISKGKHDFLPGVLDELGVRKKLQGVAQRPGKPFWFGLSERGSPVFALPGNPVSTYTCFHRYVLPALAQMSGATPRAADYVALEGEVKFAPPLAYLLPVTVLISEKGERRARHRPTNTSGDFAGLVGTDGFVELPAGQSVFPAGTVARFWSW